MKIEEINSKTMSELEYILKSIMIQRETLNIVAKSDINKFGSEQFDLLEAQNLMVTDCNNISSRLRELNKKPETLVTFGLKGFVLFERHLKHEDISKITINDFLVFENERYVVYTKMWNMDDDIIYVGLEAKDDFNRRYNK